MDQLAAGLDLNEGTDYAKLMTNVAEETAKHVADTEPEGGATNDNLLWEESLCEGAVNGIKVECTQIRQVLQTLSFTAFSQVELAFHRWVGCFVF